ncbi:MAG: hypothetical protein AB7E79_09120 [Rhodospirillaceae bacterium]
MKPSQDQRCERTKASNVLDEALEETFPASDPIACAPKRGGKDDKRADVTVQPDTEIETTDEKTPANMARFHKVFERRRR